MAHILVTGGANGFGKCIVDALSNPLGKYRHTVEIYDLPDDVLKPTPDLADLDLDILINCAGKAVVKMIPDLLESDWDSVMDVNAKGILMMTKACIPALLRSRGTIVNIVSDASHKPMTASTAYNASKAAAHMMTLQMARELKTLTVFGLSPNRLHGTPMSKYVDEQVATARGWSAEEVKAKQGVETPPELVAEFLAFLLSTKERHRYLSGTVIPYGA